MIQSLSKSLGHLSILKTDLFGSVLGKKSTDFLKYHKTLLVH